MSGQTHAMVAANAIWLTMFSLYPSENFLILLFAAALGGLLPDIDASDAKIHQKTYGITKPIGMFFKHRGFLHSWWAIAIVMLLSYLFLSPIDERLPVIIGVAYASHLFLDAMNKSGIPFLFPYMKRIRVLPRFITPKVGGMIDWLLFYFASLALILYIVVYLLPEVQIHLQ